jgi:hypothetical protein
MRSVKSGLIALAVSGFLGMAAVVGCSASGGGDSSDTSPTDPNAEGGSVPLAPQGPEPPPAPGPDGGKDSGKHDSGYDAGPPPPNPGDPCTKADSFASKPCGACGTAQAICQGDPDAGMPLVWSDYGQCMGELMGGCTPGTMQACGNCGTQTCSKYCQYGSCSMATGACKAGSTDYTGAGCAVNQYKSRTCSNACSWGAYSATCAAPNNPNKMTIPTSTGAAPASANWTFAADTVGDRLDPTFGAASCPGTASTGRYPYVIVEVQNPTAQKATVTIQSLPGTANLDVIMWAYNKTLPPPDDTALQACDYGANDNCPTASGITCPGGGGYWGGLKGVTINAGASVLVMISSYYSLDDGFGTPTGTVNIQIKTTGLM